MNTLKIEKLTVSVEGKIILKDFDLTINPREIHVLMGPNGIGKSTLTKVIMGDSNYKIESGSIYYNDKLINNMSVDERSRLGIFLGMQLPIEIEGVTNADFLRSARSVREKENFKLFEFIKELDKNIEKLQMKSDMIHRGINQGFSGGERKKNEILQMYILKPTFVMLDEIDSGLDVDSLKLVGNSVMDYFKEYKSSMLIITHHDKLLDYIKPTYIHIIQDGKIVKTGDYTLAKQIEKTGFENINIKKNNLTSACNIRGNINHE